MGAPDMLVNGTAAGGPPIGGTGTTNTIPRWTGPSTLGDSLLSQSGTIVSTASAFRVQAGTNWATNDGGLLLFSNNGYKIGFDSVGGTVGYIRYQVDTAASALHGHMFSAGALGSPTNLMFIRSDGNVGIGTTSPGALLDVNTGTAAGSYVTSTRLSQTGTAANSGQRILFHNSAQAWDQGAIGSLREGANNNFALTFFTSSAGTNAERARIDSAGNFGIGTASPSARLTVAGTGGTAAINLTESGVRNWAIRSGGAATNIFDIADLTAGASRFAIDSSGNVGIGTASPSTRLHVSDNSSIPVIVQSSGSTDSYLRFINTSNNLGYIGYIGTNLYLAPNNGAGNVGIGTASPASVISANSTVLAVAAPGGNLGTVRVSNTSNFSGNHAELFASTTSVGIWGSSNCPMLFYTNNNERARIDSSGRWLVGTTGTPTSAQVKAVVAGAGNGGQEWAASAGGGLAIIPETAGTGSFFTFTGNVGAESYTQSFKATSTGLDVSTSGYGLKLPATPGNADTQTLDCYQEGTWAPTLAGFGGTNPTVTASYTRVGRLVTIAVQIDATGGNQYSMTLGTTTITTPAGMTASSICAAPVVDGGVANRGIASVWTTGIIYLPTVALTTASTFFVATYRV